MENASKHPRLWDPHRLIGGLQMATVHIQHYKAQGFKSIHLGDFGASPTHMRAIWSTFLTSLIGPTCKKLIGKLYKTYHPEYNWSPSIRYAMMATRTVCTGWKTATKRGPPLSMHHIWREKEIPDATRPYKQARNRIITCFVMEPFNANREGGGGKRITA